MPETDAPDTNDTGPTHGRRDGRDILELYFVAFVGILVAAALIAALGYSRVSARAPLCILAPLLILIVLQLRRTIVATRNQDLGHDLSQVFSGKSAEFNKVIFFIGCMAFLLGLIFVAGHYIAIGAFIFVLLRYVASESKKLASAVAVGVAGIMYLLFEHGFHIELYRGLVYRVVENRLL